jgi:hypothetical protein
MCKFTSNCSRNGRAGLYSDTLTLRALYFYTRMVFTPIFWKHFNNMGLRMGWLMEYSILHVAHRTAGFHVSWIADFKIFFALFAILLYYGPVAQF